MASLHHKGVDLTGDVGNESLPISWHEPHPAFVILLVGEQEIPYGIQKDLLCAKSPHYREYFASLEGQIEYIVRLPKTDPAAFGCLQNYLFTGRVYADASAPDYSTLLGVWKLATELRMHDAQVAVLDAMADRRLQTSCIPGRELLVQVWEQTGENSGLRLMLTSWAAEHMRSLPPIPACERNEFARKLPNEILQDLVVIMSELPEFPAHGASFQRAPNQAKHILHNTEVANRPIKRARIPDSNPAPSVEIEKKLIKKASHKAEPVRRKSIPVAQGPPSKPSHWTDSTDIEYCKDLINRMIRGPGYWTRLVGPFRRPVDPDAEKIPNYLDVIKNPMDLTTISERLHSGKYQNGRDFEKDVRQIFENCYEYWRKEDTIWKQCQDFEKYFNTQWGERYRWTPGSKYHRMAVKHEVID
ncbi:hypothetical protein BJ878DRAFT_206230 [Calycina marina]|uniref:Uncharacterized protein n=1 Tax=Calycina marina TaxID=1763456 RepID=A0A9P8CE14_9HELO|nr:hypothetical protein BJ878DRAFT_206230 [Calycina marina]